jgi:hypothetical protein
VIKGATDTRYPARVRWVIATLFSASASSSVSRTGRPMSFPDRESTGTSATLPGEVRRDHDAYRDTNRPTPPGIAKAMSVLCTAVVIAQT